VCRPNKISWVYFMCLRMYYWYLIVSRCCILQECANARESRYREKVTKITNFMSWVLLEKPPVAQLLKNFPTFYGTRRFITMFKRALHWSISWARLIQSIPPLRISIMNFVRKCHTGYQKHLVLFCFLVNTSFVPLYILVKIRVKGMTSCIQNSLLICFSG
jgi:hypothetical protein